MDGFEWAENNLGVGKSQELQAKGVNVYVAPNVLPDAKVVNLANGQINWFQGREARPERGYFADFEGLVRYGRQIGTPISETNGWVSTQPVGFAEAGDPLLHGGE